MCGRGMVESESSARNIAYLEIEMTMMSGRLESGMVVLSCSTSQIARLELTGARGQGADLPDVHEHKSCMYSSNDSIVFLCSSVGRHICSNSEVQLLCASQLDDPVSS